MSNKPSRILLSLALSGALFSTTTAVMADETNRWRFDASLNLFLAGMSGEVAAKGLPAGVDASFHDILEHLEACAAGRLTVSYERWSLSTELSYLSLTAEAPAVRAEMQQWLIEPSLNYQFCEGFALFAGARYNNLDGDLKFNGPLGKVPTGTQDWWDPIVGAQLSLPLLRKILTFDGRFDVGGFGAGSDITWQAFPYLNWRFTKWGSAQFGYRWLGTDYETGSGLNKFRYDVVLQGPQIGFTIHF